MSKVHHTEFTQGAAPRLQYHSRLLWVGIQQSSPHRRRSIASSSTCEEWMAAAALHDDGSLEWNGSESLERVGVGSIWTKRCHRMMPSDAKYETWSIEGWNVRVLSSRDRGFREEGEDLKCDGKIC